MIPKLHIKVKMIYIQHHNECWHGFQRNQKYKKMSQWTAFDVKPPNTLQLIKPGLLLLGAPMHYFKNVQ